MPATIHLQIKKEFAAALIADLQLWKAVEIIDDGAANRDAPVDLAATNEEIDLKLANLKNEWHREYLADVKRRFQLYKEIWEAETRFSSSTTQIINHPAYLHVIALGSDVVPFILRDMVETGNYWFFALYKLTGANPIPETHAGKIQYMISDWVQWAQDNNIDF